jgi:hypothetical protein
VTLIARQAERTTVTLKSQKCMIHGMARTIWSAVACRRFGAPARRRAMAGSELPAIKREQAPALHM